jgi:membrane protease YdiL (CAAX protease family)
MAMPMPHTLPVSVPTAPHATPDADHPARTVTASAATSSSSSSVRRTLVLPLALFASFEAFHVAFAWNGAGLLTTLVPGIGVWLGPALWGIYAVIALVFTAVLHAWDRTGLTRRPAHGWVRLSWAPVAAGLPFLAFGFNLEPSAVVPLLVVGTPLIALNEELMFRGILLDLLRPLGWRRAVIWSAVLFGSGHLLNLVAGANIPFTAMQVAATTAGGVALAAIRIRTGSLWSVVAIHIVLDVVAIATLTGPAVDSPILLPVLFAWLGANLLLWRYGWSLLAGRSDEELNALADGRGPGPQISGEGAAVAAPTPAPAPGGPRAG